MDVASGIDRHLLAKLLFATLIYISTSKSYVDVYPRNRNLHYLPCTRSASGCICDWGWCPYICRLVIVLLTLFS